MWNSRWLLGPMLFSLATLPACSGKTSLGAKGLDAGRDVAPSTGSEDASPAAPDASVGGDVGAAADAPVVADLGRDVGGVADAFVGRDVGSEGAGMADTPPSKDLGIDSGVALDAPMGKDLGTDVAGVCTPGMDQTCNDSPVASWVAGTCQKNGTCVCGSGFVLNPDSGKCGRAEANTCAGSYDACGCGCCTGKSPTSVCYYPSAGDSLASIKAADEEVKASPTCANAGCAAGLRYICCAEAPPEPAGNALYSATATMTAVDRVQLKKTESNGHCVSITITNPGSGSGVRPLRISLPTGWGMASVAAGACNGPVAEEVVGAQGTITLNPSGNTCTMNAHLTLFHSASTTDAVTTTRFDADNVLINGGLSSNYCPGQP